MPIRRSRRAKRSTPLDYSKSTPNNDIARLWAYKVVVKMDVWRKLKDYCTDDGVFEFLGISHLREEGELIVYQKVLMQELKLQLTTLENQNIHLDSVLSKNLDRLVNIIKLNDTEIQVLSFVIILRSCKGLLDITDELGELSLNEVFETLSFILNISHQKIKTALNPNNTLCQSGLLKVDRDYANELQRRLELMDGLADSLLIADVNIEDVFDRYFSLASAGKLAIDDYDYNFLLSVYDLYDINKSSSWMFDEGIFNDYWSLSINS